jgi:hypothetical protein
MCHILGPETLPGHWRWNENPIDVKLGKDVHHGECCNDTRDQEQHQWWVLREHENNEEILHKGDIPIKINFPSGCMSWNEGTFGQHSHNLLNSAKEREPGGFLYSFKIAPLWVERAVLSLVRKVHSGAAYEDDGVAGDESWLEESIVEENEKDDSCMWCRRVTLSWG